MRRIGESDAPAAERRLLEVGDGHALQGALPLARASPPLACACEWRP